MAAPDPSYIVENPPPLNARDTWPFRIDEFPADTLFGVLGQLAPNEEPPTIEPVPERYETR